MGPGLALTAGDPGRQLRGAREHGEAQRHVDEAPAVPPRFRGGDEDARPDVDERAGGDAEQHGGERRAHAAERERYQDPQKRHDADGETGQQRLDPGPSVTADDRADGEPRGDFVQEDGEEHDDAKGGIRDHRGADRDAVHQVVHVEGREGRDRAAARHGGRRGGVAGRSLTLGVRLSARPAVDRDLVHVHVAQVLREVDQQEPDPDHERPQRAPLDRLGHHLEKGRGQQEASAEGQRARHHRRGGLRLRGRQRAPQQVRRGRQHAQEECRQHACMAAVTCGSARRFIEAKAAIRLPTVLGRAGSAVVLDTPSS